MQWPGTLPPKCPIELRDSSEHKAATERPLTKAVRSTLTVATNREAAKAKGSLRGLIADSP
jgi:hypothetical protein